MMWRRGMGAAEREETGWLMQTEGRRKLPRSGEIVGDGKNEDEEEEEGTEGKLCVGAW